MEGDKGGGRIKYFNYFAMQLMLMSRIVGKRFENIIDVDKPKHRLAVREKKGGSQCYKIGCGKENYISLDDEQVSGLVVSNYVYLIAECMRKYVHILEKGSASIRRAGEIVVKSYALISINRAFDLRPQLRRTVIKRVLYIVNNTRDEVDNLLA